ncbi:MAG: hypothetical protein EZS28_050595 [Streblomastix strix]|uniref:Uncharacterized protein n=1 Tax=Streblomastix strix TaxID=222440 RepID=A0A5J4T6S0_9EUKA|nr:MAG: hypothetical protein EZS28_050595 [Streblomastix strix]
MSETEYQDEEEGEGVFDQEDYEEVLADYVVVVEIKEDAIRGGVVLYFSYCVQDVDVLVFAKISEAPEKEKRFPVCDAGNIFDANTVFGYVVQAEAKGFSYQVDGFQLTYLSGNVTELILKSTDQQEQEQKEIKRK